MQQALPSLFLLWTLCTFPGSGDVSPGSYEILHRQTGQYLLRDATLGALSTGAATWDVKPGARAGHFFISHAETGALLSPEDAKAGETARVTLSGSDSANPWNFFRVCQGSTVAIVDQSGRALSANGSSVIATVPDAGLSGMWVLLRPCMSKDGSPTAWRECFPVGTEWSSAAADCCSVDLHGPRGREDCFDEAFTFERCCPEAQEPKTAPSELSATAAVQSRILCSGERIDGEERSVKVARFDGDHHWVKSSNLIRLSRFDFSVEDSSAKILRVEMGLPSCGGPDLLDEAARLLPATELHMVKILRTLHEAMVALAHESLTAMPGLAHSIFYLPFFPFLLMHMHHLFRTERYLQCVSHSASFLGQLPAWQRNAGYDFVLPLGYDRPWEKRGNEEAYYLHAYDPRFANTLLLATHDAFFGDRHALFQSNQGGAAYRNLRNIIVPLPFTLNCTSWRVAMGQRRWSRRPPRFRVSFVGSMNGVSRNLVHAASEKLKAALDPSKHELLAIRFVHNDEERRRLAEEPGRLMSTWFRGLASFDHLLRESAHCLVLPGDVSDLALRFLHAVSVGCTPVLVGGPAQTIPLPFAALISFERFARFATVHDVGGAVALLQELLAEPLPKRGRAPSHRVEDIRGLFTHHADCGFPSGEPFRKALAMALQERARLWSQIRWFN